MAASQKGSGKRHNTAEDKRAIQLSRWFRSSFGHNHHQRQPQQQQQQQLQQQTDNDGDVSPIDWTSHAWTFDELIRLYAKKLPVIVRATRGYYGQPRCMQLDVGQVYTSRIPSLLHHVFVRPIH